MDQDKLAILKNSDFFSNNRLDRKFKRSKQSPAVSTKENTDYNTIINYDYDYDDQGDKSNDVTKEIILPVSPDNSSNYSTNISKKTEPSVSPNISIGKATEQGILPVSPDNSSNYSTNISKKTEPSVSPNISINKATEQEILPVSPDISIGKATEQEILPVSPDISIGKATEQEILPVSPDISIGKFTPPNDANKEVMVSDIKIPSKKQQIQDIRQAKTGKFSKKSLEAARQLIGTKQTDKQEIYGPLSVPNKKLSTEEKTIKQNAETLLRIRRQEELKQAKQGNFSGINLTIPEYSVSQDKKHYEQLLKLKEKDKKKKQEERKEKKEARNRIKKISFGNTDQEFEQPTYFQEQDFVKVGSQEQTSTVNSFLYGSRDTTEETTEESSEFSMDEFYSSLRQTKNTLAQLSTSGATSKNAERATAAMNKMKSVQEIVQQNDIKLRSGIVSNTKQKDMGPNLASNYSIPQTKRQPNIQRPFVQKDIASIVNERSKEYPEYKQMYG